MSSDRPIIHLGAVSFLNARPLIYELDSQADLKLELDVPARLLDGLTTQRFDVAMLPVIDFQRLENLCVVPAGGIGCDGPTLTVRLFARQPIETIRTLACDSESHTSVALARIILAERFGIEPKFIDLRDAGNSPDEGRLLIGDKVVCEEPPGFGYQLDLGAAWKDLTGMPFCFAVWIARRGVDLRDLPRRLAQAKRDGLANVSAIIREHAIPRGWPSELARRYLTEYLQFDIGEPQLAAVRLFHRKAAEQGLISNPPRPLVLYGED